jgi:hypothetical protein
MFRIFSTAAVAALGARIQDARVDENQPYRQVRQSLETKQQSEEEQ